MERCPNCRARTDGSATCRRCGMDLVPLQSVEQAAEQALRDALMELARGRQGAAARAVRRALLLRRTPLAEQVARFIGRQQEATLQDLLQCLRVEP